MENRPDVVLGLLTGNWRRGAELKLRHFDLWHYFKLGAFADDSEFRDRLPEVASRRFRELTDRPISPRDMFVIGDTPLDVACARPFGARSVAVATGFFSYEELQEAKPDFLLRDLSDRAAFLNLVIERN
ncbi:MAG: hypothetical protein D6743_10410 [Calditrichaeota bacterium]|nr:MAG: hypothetical protein D6743_10410 [Calditrichota bacterium]